ncbi:MAG: 3-phosphoshikimate 1-carboxyvinyltransferase, partial [Acidimicrobiales bacterium]|nr:3-phosphoshikimate 1-carboxyvinyltransferase [Acidimicrobiales bacterium]
MADLDLTDLASLPDPLPIRPVDGPLDADVTVPGSKSITNRALICAALADGISTLSGALAADDVDAMVGVLSGVGIEISSLGTTLTVTGCAGRPSEAGGPLDVRQSGTTARFLTPLLALGTGPYEVTAHPQMRARPMDATFEALRTLGTSVDEESRKGHLPARLVPGTGGSDEIELAGDASSQFLSGLLLSAPCRPSGLTVRLTTVLVSRPYVDLTIAVMESFGARVDRPDDSTFVVHPTGYRATDYAVEPDASAASYPLAAAAICGGRVRVVGLGPGALQGDAAFADVLAAMGVQVTRDAVGTEVRAVKGALAGGAFDLTHVSDTAQTLACVAPFATSEVRIGGIGFIRRKEIDRVTAVATELHRCGVDVTVDDDGWTIRPSRPAPAVVETYEDHR